MSFYRRYGALPRTTPSMLETNVLPSRVPPGVPAGGMTVPMPAPIPARLVSNLETFKIGPPPLPFMQPGPLPLFSLPPRPPHMQPVTSTDRPPQVPGGGRPDVETSIPAPREARPPTPPVAYTDSGSAGGSGSGAGGGAVPDVAWDQREEIVEVAMPDGSTALMVQSKTPMLAIAAAGAGGYALMGPLGALVGAAVGYFVGRPKPEARASAQIAFYRR